MKEFKIALKNTFPIFFTYLFIGIAFGILMNNAGYGILLSVVSAVFIFAGSMQLIMVPMMVSGASLLSIAVMTPFCKRKASFLRNRIYRSVQKDGHQISVYDSYFNRRNLFCLMFRKIRR